MNHINSYEEYINCKNQLIDKYFNNNNDIEFITINNIIYIIDNGECINTNIEYNLLREKYKNQLLKNNDINNHKLKNDEQNLSNLLILKLNDVNNYDKYWISQGYYKNEILITRYEYNNDKFALTRYKNNYNFHKNYNIIYTYNISTDYKDDSLCSRLYQSKIYQIYNNDITIKYETDNEYNYITLYDYLQNINNSNIEPDIININNGLLKYNSNLNKEYDFLILKKIISISNTKYQIYNVTNISSYYLYDDNNFILNIHWNGSNQVIINYNQELKVHEEIIGALLSFIHHEISIYGSEKHKNI